MKYQFNQFKKIKNMLREFSYSPLPDFKSLGYAKERICITLKDCGTLSDNEMITKLAVKYLMNPKTIRANRKKLIQDGIILKTESGKYQLRKAVCLEQSENPFITNVDNGKILNSEVKYFDLDEVPCEIRDAFIKSDLWRASLKNSSKE